MKPAEAKPEDPALSQDEIDAAAAAEASTAEVPVAEVAAEPESKPAEAKSKKDKGRIEKFEATRPDGSVVVIVRNIDTGEQTLTEK